MAQRKLTDEDWIQIKILRDKGESYQAIGDKFGVSKVRVRDGLLRKEKAYKKLMGMFK